jgi:hypothetical protein
MGEPQYELPPGQESEDEQAVGKMGFLEHLDELRSRLIYSCIAVALHIGTDEML